MSKHLEQIFTHKHTFRLMENAAHPVFTELSELQLDSLVEELDTDAVLLFVCSPFV